jgi:capsular exopolysaccharide synthesis family protein
MTLHEYMAIAKRWWWLVLIGCLLAGGSAYVLTSRMTPIYSARAVLLVNQIQDPRAITYQDILGNQSLTKTYARLATSNINLQRALDQLRDPSLDLAALGRKVSAADITDTQLIQVTAEDANPQRAAIIANAVAEAFPGYIHDAQIAGSNDGTVANTIFVAQQATPATAPVRPNKQLNTGLGLFLGLVVMLGAVAFIEYLDDDIDTGEDIEAIGLPFLGSVIRVKPPKGMKNKDDWYPKILGGDVPVMEESYRKLQANLSFSLKATGATVLLVSSASPGEGKTTTAANLATVLAESSRRVLLIDGDLRKPSLHRFFSLANSSGLSAAFLARPTAPPFTPWLTDTLALLTSGTLPPNPPELLTSKHMAALMKMLSEEFDVIVVDTPPILAVADTTLWLALASGVVLVAREDKTRRGALAAAAAAVRASNVPILGVVLNGANPKRSSSYYYYPYGDKHTGATQDV